MEPTQNHTSRRGSRVGCFLVFFLVSRFFPGASD